MLLSSPIERYLLSLLWYDLGEGGLLSVSKIRSGGPSSAALLSPGRNITENITLQLVTTP